MFASRSLRDQAMQLLAADAATLAPPALANFMCLSKGDFVAGEQLTLADVVEADFPGYTRLDQGLGAQLEGFDPATDASVIDLKAPVSGFRWQTNMDVTPPQTIYGYYLVDNGVTQILASYRFTDPILLTLNNQVIDIGDARLSLQPNTIT